MNESVLNYETVKYFQNENLEKYRYSKIADAIKKVALKVQYSLGYLNIG